MISQEAQNEGVGKSGRYRLGRIDLVECKRLCETIQNTLPISRLSALFFEVLELRRSWWMGDYSEDVISHITNLDEFDICSSVDDVWADVDETLFSWLGSRLLAAYAVMNN